MGSSDLKKTLILCAGYTAVLIGIGWFLSGPDRRVNTVHFANGTAVEATVEIERLGGRETIVIGAGTAARRKIDGAFRARVLKPRPRAWEDFQVDRGPQSVVFSTSAWTSFCLTDVTYNVKYLLRTGRNRDAQKRYMGRWIVAPPADYLFEPPPDKLRVRWLASRTKQHFGFCTGTPRSRNLFKPMTLPSKESWRVTKELLERPPVPGRGNE